MTNSSQEQDSDTHNSQVEDASDSAAFADADNRQATTPDRRLSGLALLSALLAATSMVAFATWVLWWVPWLAIFVSGLAIYGLRNDPRRKGRRLTVIALTVAIVIAAAAPTRSFTRSRRVIVQAQQASVEWLELLGSSQDEDGETDNLKLAQAYQLRLPMTERQRADGSLVDYYLEDNNRLAKLEEFANDRLIHTLHTLGQRATAQPFSTVSCRQEAGVDHVTLVCAVTFLRDGRPETFFVELDLERLEDEKASRGIWRIAGYRSHSPAKLSAG